MIAELYDFLVRLDEDINQQYEEVEPTDEIYTYEQLNKSVRERFGGLSLAQQLQL